MQACDLCVYWSPLVLRAVQSRRTPSPTPTTTPLDSTTNLSTTTTITPAPIAFSEFSDFLVELLGKVDDAAQLIACCGDGQSVTREDMMSVVEHVVATHPGLAFLAGTPEFQRRYIETVVERIFFTVNRCASKILEFQ